MILFIVSDEKNLLSKMLFSAHRYLLYEEWLRMSKKNGFRSLLNSFSSNRELFRLSRPCISFVL